MMLKIKSKGLPTKKACISPLISKVGICFSRAQDSIFEESVRIPLIVNPALISNSAHSGSTTVLPIIKQERVLSGVHKYRLYKLLKKILVISFELNFIFL
jgi:hypothetical protein